MKLLTYISPYSSKVTFEPTKEGLLPSGFYECKYKRNTLWLECRVFALKLFEAQYVRPANKKEIERFTFLEKEYKDKEWYYNDEFLN